MINMNKPLFFLWLSALYLLLFATAGYADDRPDYAREARLAEQIVDDIFDGEPVWLEANDHRFLGIHTLYEDQAKGTVIILHGRGYHPDWQDVAGPLRTGLLEAGWSTLSIQMPVLEKGRLYYDYLPLFKFSRGRIDSAIAFLDEAPDQTIILAAHSCGAHMANDWLNNSDDSKIDGYIIMGAGATDYRQELKTPFPFANMQVPVLDIYGENEFPRPLSMVAERQTLLEAGGNPDSRIQMLPDADHYFHQAGDSLTNAVSLWLNTTDFSRKP